MAKGFNPSLFANGLSGKGFHSITRVDLSGLDEMLDEIERFGTEGLVAARDAMAEAAQKIKAKAIPLIPDDPETQGLLAQTARVYASRTKSLKPGAKIYAGVVVGGTKLQKVLGKRKYIAWPLIQHEDLTLKHTKGEAKFLEKPGNEIAPSIPGEIQKKLDALGLGSAR